MDSFELNKVLGALLGTCLFLVSLNIATGALFAPSKMAKPGYEIDVPEHAARGGAAAPAEAEEPIEVRLASASPERGQAASKVCQACHNFEKGAPNKVGPHLWDVVGRERASVPNFNYSNAMKSKGGAWTIPELDAYLKNPKAIVPGTNMSYAGMSRATQRADLIAYLNSLSDNPAPLPKAAEAPASGNPQPANAGAQPNAQQGQAPRQQ
jgi:cytochrome c